MNKIRYALLSVSDKTGILDFARILNSLNIKIISTGGTATLLEKFKLPVIRISEYTGFPEIMDGRIKTLHPKIHGGLLGRRGIDEAIMLKHDIKLIDLVVVNLYPFEKVTEHDKCTLRMAIENIDIGGLTILRASAKNYSFVTVLIDPSDYDRVTRQLERIGSTDDATRLNLAVKTFEHTAHYDGVIANFLGNIKADNRLMKFPLLFNRKFNKVQDMRYGENPHQEAAFYVESDVKSGSIGAVKQLQGKKMSYNNIADADIALECVKAFPEAPTCVIVKHNNPCGIAMSNNLLSAYDLAYQTDVVSAFGGIIAFNRTLDGATAQSIIDRQFVEIIIAPDISDEAKIIVKQRSNVRLLCCGSLPEEQVESLDFKRVTGGLLVQDRDIAMVTASEFNIVTEKAPTVGQILDLLFAWRVVKFVKSNAIVYVNNQHTIGIGAGQMSRIISSQIAEIKAKNAALSIAGSVMASDAFFPFRDGLDAAANIEIGAIIQPGGSMRDDEIIEAANEYEISMVFTGIRHFRH